jgi:hypothetical protein
MPSTKHNKVWGSNQSTKDTHELTTPSGQTCSARKMTPDRLLSEGILNQADGLTALVTQHMSKGQNPGKLSDEAVLELLVSEGGGMDAVFDLADRALPLIVVDPPVRLHFETVTVGKTTVKKELTPEQRQAVAAAVPDVVFTDQIDFEDKMWLFEWAMGGMTQAAAFRGKSGNAVANVAHGPVVQHKAKRARRKS